MQLGEILSKSGRAQPVKPHAVEFTAVGEDSNNAVVTARVQAVLICLSEDQRTRARVHAHEELRRRFDGKQVPTGVDVDEEIYHVLQLALCQPETENGRYSPIAATTLELRNALVLNEAKRLWREYNAYLDREFPEQVDDETWKQLVEDAKKNSLLDLLTAYGYGRVVQLATSLRVIPST